MSYLIDLMNEYPNFTALSFGVLICVLIHPYVMQFLNDPNWVDYGDY